MVLLPQGLVSKTRRMPIATVLIAVITSFFSAIHFDDIQQGQDVFWHSSSRVAYAKQAQSYLLKKCAQEQATTFCVGLEQIPLRFFLVPTTLNLLMDQGPEGSQWTHLIGYISDELQPERLQSSNPSLYSAFQKSEAIKKKFAKTKNFLSADNTHWIAGLRSLFIHSNWVHLATNMIFLFFLAFPVEERLGGPLFFLTYLGTGLIGSLSQVWLDPSGFYLVGASSAICGISGALAVFFWKNNAKVFLSLFFIRSKSVYIPVYLYSLIFLVSALAVDLLMPFHNIAHIAHFAGFAGGGLISFMYMKLRPLPDYFTYPYEFEFLKRTKENLSQYDRIKVYAEWLYYAPTNMQAFRAFAKEVKRSSTNPKVNKVLNKFRLFAFSEVYELNKRNVDFLKLLPVRWLSWASVGHSPSFLRGLGEKYVEERNFEMAFKMYFLTMNEVGWRNNDDAIELFKNYKKACIDPHFVEESKVLQDRHSQFGGFIKKRDGFAVA